MLNHIPETKTFEFIEMKEINFKMNQEEIELDFQTNIEVFKELMKNGSSKSHNDPKTGDTPIYIIANMDDCDQAKKYLTEFLKDNTSQVDINVKNTLTGETALHYCTKKNKVPISEILLNPKSVNTIYDKGADPLIQDNNGKTTVDVLIQNKEPGSEVIAELFLKFSGSFQNDYDNQILKFENQQRTDLRKTVVRLKLDEKTKTKGDLDVTLSWTGQRIDLDLIVYCPHNEMINAFGNDERDNGVQNCPKCKCTFNLDANICKIYTNNQKTPTEHVYWNNYDDVKEKEIEIEVKYISYHNSDKPELVPETATFYVWVIKNNGPTLIEITDKIDLQQSWRKKFTIPRIQITNAKNALKK